MMPCWPGAAQDSTPIPEPIRSSITVVEKLSTEAPASVVVLDRPAIDETPGVNLDDRLRMVPGFTLFRRSSSLVANPTTQGVSLRGLGSTGASRTLVLWDGVPINDPFGGWVYWTRVAPEELERVELSRGSSTSVFGDRALGGAIALFTRPPERGRLRGGYEGGSLGSHILTGGYADLFAAGARQVGLSTNIRAFDTDGYFIIPEEFRGGVDRRANVRFTAGDIRLDFFGARQSLFLKLDVLAEERGNGTVLQRNSTSLGNLAANYAWEGTRNTFSLLGYHTRGEFRAGFSAILAGRNSENLTTRQSVPSEATGGAVLWRHAGQSFSFVAGSDAQRAEGYSLETVYPSLIRREGGGTAVQAGGFGQGEFRFGGMRAFAGGRVQRAAANNYFFPSAGLTAGSGRWRGRVSAYKAFRAPTLNELYREFRAGNAVTLANAALQPESLTGVEAGFDVVGEGRQLGITVFRNALDDLITNVTLSAAGGQITRQRQNAGKATGRGAEVEFRQRWRQWHSELAYLFVESRFDNRNRTPQIPKHGGSAQIGWAGRTTQFTGGFRSTSSQFDDDLNNFLLPGFGILQFTARQQLGHGLSAIAAVENLTDRVFYVGFTPVPSNGMPRLWRLGLRWEGRVR
jgi:outer membrane receptor protein involved in Fe transport